MPERDAFVKRARARIEEWSAEIGRREAEMRAGADREDLALQSRLDRIRALRGEAQDAITHLTEAPPELAGPALDDFAREWARIETEVDAAREA